MPGIEVTKNYIRVRQEEPSKYTKMRHGTLSEKDGIDVVYGVTKEGKSEIQSYLFKVDKWDEEKVREWIKEHDAKIMNFSLSDVSLFKLPDVEIFRAGTWNGDKYTSEDIAEISNNFSRFKKDNPDFQLPLKLGHNQDDREPAVGWIDNVKQVGDRLYADLVDIPETIYNFIRLKGYKNRSIELIEKYNTQGKVVGKMLRGMALLGASMPAVNLRNVESGVPGLTKLGKALYGKHFSEDDNFKIVEFSEEEIMPDEEVVKEPVVEEMVGEEPVVEDVKEEIVEPKQEDVIKSPKEEAIEPVVDNMAGFETRIAELEAKINELMNVNKDLGCKVAEYAAKDKETQLKIQSDYVSGLVDSGKVLPAQKELIFGLLTSLDESEIKLNFSDGSEKVNTKINLFKEILDNLPVNNLLKRESIVEDQLDYTGVVNKFSQDMYQKEYRSLNAEETREVLNKIGKDSKYNKFLK